MVTFVSYTIIIYRTVMLFYSYVVNTNQCIKILKVNTVIFGPLPPLPFPQYSSSRNCP